jgi:hypothetical protein
VKLSSFGFCTCRGTERLKDIDPLPCTVTALQVLDLPSEDNNNEHAQSPFRSPPFSRSLCKLQHGNDSDCRLSNTRLKLHLPCKPTHPELPFSNPFLRDLAFHSTGGASTISLGLVPRTPLDYPADCGERDSLKSTRCMSLTTDSTLPDRSRVDRQSRKKTGTSVVRVCWLSSFYVTCGRILTTRGT